MWSPGRNGTLASPPGRAMNASGWRNIRTGRGEPDSGPGSCRRRSAHCNAARVAPPRDGIDRTPVGRSGRNRPSGRLHQPGRPPLPRPRPQTLVAPRRDAAARRPWGSATVGRIGGSSGSPAAQKRTTLGSAMVWSAILAWMEGPCGPGPGRRRRRSAGPPREVPSRAPAFEPSRKRVVKGIAWDVSQGCSGEPGTLFFAPGTAIPPLPAESASGGLFDPTAPNSLTRLFGILALRNLKLVALFLPTRQRPVGWAFRRLRSLVSRCVGQLSGFATFSLPAPC